MTAKMFGHALPNWVPPRRPDMARLDGAFVSLEALDVAAHAADLYRANSADDAIWDYMPYGPFPSEAAYAAWVQEASSGSDPAFWAIRSKETGRCGGVASYLRIAPEAGSIEVGHINFAPELQRSRGATEAIFLLMGWVFDAGYRRFEWKCDALNMGSRRAAERFGLSYEGVFRQATVYKGRNRDTAWFAAIDAEWPALKEAYVAWFAPSNFDEQGQQIQPLGAFTSRVRAASDPAL